GDVRVPLRSPCPDDRHDHGPMMRGRAAARRARVAAALCACAWFVAASGSAVAQSAAEPYAPAQHWSREALRQLAGAGHLDVAWAAAAWPLPRSRVAALFAEAAVVAESAGGAGAAGLARAFPSPFRGGFPEPGRGGRSLRGPPAGGRRGAAGGGEPR